MVDLVQNGTRDFQKSHPEVSDTFSQNLTVAGETVAEQQIRDWFEEIKNCFISDIFISKQLNRVFNADDTEFFL